MSKLGGKVMSENTDADTLATGIVASVVGGDRITVDNSDPTNPIVTADVQAGGQVDSVVAGTRCSVDVTDPVNPIVNVDAFTGEANTNSNAGAGEGTISKTKSGVDLPLKTLKAGTNITITNNADDIQIDAAGGGGDPSTRTTKGDLEGFSTVDARIPVGTNGQVLEADSAQALGVKWATPAAGGSVATDAIFDAKGDLAGGTGADTAARLPVGTNGQVLSADSAEATGLKWIAAGAGGGAPQGARLSRITNQAGDGDVDVTFPVETYDDNGFGAGGTANRLTVPTGVTRVNVSANIQGTGGTADSLLQLNIQRFSSGDAFIETNCQVKVETTDTAPALAVCALGQPCVAGDYFKVRVFSSDLAWTISNANFTIQDVTP